MHSVFERLDKADLVALFTQSENLVKSLSSHFSEKRFVFAGTIFSNLAKNQSTL